VEFRHLGALAAVAREGSFRRAAERLGYVQSAISGQIAQLERAVGTQLVERSSGSGGATLTPAGLTLLGHVDEILARFDAARIDLRSLVDGTGAVVRVGVVEGIGHARLPRILGEFCERFPTAQVIIDETSGDERNFARLGGGDLDIMITELPLAAGPFEHALLERDRYVLLVAAGSPLAEQDELACVDQLSRLPLIVAAPVRQQDPIVTRLHDSMVDQPPWLRPRTIASVQAMVGAGLGAGILPRLAVDTRDASTKIIEIPSLLPERLIVLAKHREREYSAFVQGFVEIARAEFSRSSET
jgi:DNA-binding transcriptional LysR family regulator